jgi:transient receptor potential cation channel subfamily M protein 3
MALLLWKYGSGALAKALVAVKLNKYLADELASTEKTETNMATEFQAYASEWESLSLDLLDTCFKADTKMARQLLTMELESWSKQTCLTLAVICNHRMLLGHPCSQILLADLWMGALNMTRHSTLKVPKTETGPNCYRVGFFQTIVSDQFHSNTQIHTKK